MKSMKLTIELVPKPCFYSNLRNQMRPAEWDKLRKQVYAEYSRKCGICGAKVILHWKPRHDLGNKYVQYCLQKNPTLDEWGNEPGSSTRL